MTTDELKEKTEKAVETSKAVAVKSKAQVITEMVLAQNDKLSDVLQSSLTPERFTRMVMNAFNTTPKLVECSQASLVSSMMNAAALGLEPNTPMAYAYLIPYGKRCQFIIGYKGLLELVRRSGKVRDVAAQPVHANDLFEYEYGSNAQLKHKPAMGDRGDLQCFYAYARLHDGGFAFEVMTVEEVNAIRDRGNQRGDSPWTTDYVAMGCKTVLRKLTKLLPMSLEASEIVAREDEIIAEPTEEVPHDE